MRFPFQRVLAAAALLGLTGCSSLHLYNKTADETATAASKDYADSKVGDTFQQLRANADAMEAKEVAAFRQLTFAMRDSTLLSLMASAENPADPRTVKNGFIGRYTTAVRERLVELDGDPDTRQGLRAQYRKAANKLATTIDQEDKLREQLQKFYGAPVLPKCDKSFALTPGLSVEQFLQATGHTDSAFAPRLRLFWAASYSPSQPTPIPDSFAAIATNIISTCQQRKLQQAELDKFAPDPGRELAKATAELQRLQQARKDAAASAQAAKAALEAASAELAAATAAVNAQAEPPDLTCPAPKTADAPAAPAAPAAATSKICAALAQLSKAGDAGLKLLAEEKLKRIQAVLAAASGLSGKTGDADLDQSLALLSAATRLGHALGQYRNAGTLPALEPLIIEKQLADVELAQANAGLRLAKAREAQARALVDGMHHEINALAEGYATIRGYGTPKAGDDCRKSLHCDSMEALLASRTNVNGVPVSRTAYRSMVLLSESYSVGRDMQQTARVRQAAIDYQDALLRSESAVAAWQAIIDTPIAQLKTYHEGVLKPDTLIALLQALGVVGIATK